MMPETIVCCVCGFTELGINSTEIGVSGYFECDPCWVERSQIEKGAK